MRAVFLADAHLCQPDDRNYQLLLHFLAEQTGRTDLLVLLGDIFEFWVGKNTVVANYRPLIDAFEHMHQQGTQMIYVEGNHDFHLGPVFTERLACRVFPDGGSLELDGKRVYLAHGDLANPEDCGYRRLRTLLRSKPVRCLLRALPSNLIMAIAARAGQQSRKSSSAKRQRWPAEEILKNYAEGFLAAGHQAVVTGHYHQPLHQQLAGGELIALGDWITQYSYAVYENRCFTLHSYHPRTSSATSNS